MPDRVDLYNNKIRGNRTQFTTTSVPQVIKTNSFVPPPRQ